MMLTGGQSQLTDTLRRRYSCVRRQRTARNGKRDGKRKRVVLLARLTGATNVKRVGLVQLKPTLGPTPRLRLGKPSTLSEARRHSWQPAGRRCPHCKANRQHHLNLNNHDKFIPTRRTVELPAFKRLTVTSGNQTSGINSRQDGFGLRQSSLR